MDKRGKTDAYCVLYDLSKGGQPKQLGMTEFVADNLNPQFVKEILADYMFEQQQTFKIDVYDADDATQLQNFKKQELIGSVEFVLGSVCASRNQEKEMSIENPKLKNCGKIKIMCEEKAPNYGKMQASFVCSARLKNSANCFLTISKFRNKGKYNPVYKSECIKKQGQAHSWNKVLIDTDTLCNADNDQDILFQIFAFDRSGQGKHKKEGQAVLSLATFIDSGGTYSVSIGEGNQLEFKDFEVKQRVTFLDYIMGGCEMNVQVAIDFTGSNGDPRYSNSLHYLNP